MLNIQSLFMYGIDGELNFGSLGKELEATKVRAME